MLSIYPQIILILRHVGHLDWGRGLKKQSLSIPLFNPKPPVAFGSLSESLFHPGDSDDKHVVPTKDSESSQQPAHSQFHPPLPPPPLPYKKNISKPSGFATLLKMKRLSALWLSAQPPHQKSILPFHFES